MMVPEFMRFYNYTTTQALDELAKTFFSLVNSMYRLQAKESLEAIVNTSTAMSGGGEADKVISELKKQEKGVSGIVDEVRIIKP